jgi:hypothetical protein
MVGRSGIRSAFSLQCISQTPSDDAGWKMLLDLPTSDRFTAGNQDKTIVEESLLSRPTLAYRFGSSAIRTVAAAWTWVRLHNSGKAAFRPDLLRSQDELNRPPARKMLMNQ